MSGTPRVSERGAQALLEDEPLQEHVFHKSLKLCVYAVAARLESANWHVLSSLEEEEEDEKFKEHNADKTSCASEKPFSSSRGCSKESRVPRDLETLLLMSQGGGMIFFFFFLA